MNKAVKMAANEEKENQAQAEEKTPAEENFTSELNEPCWAVVSFETCAAKDLTYPQAEETLKELESQKVAGLCIVTNEVAAKIS
jgi:hypothetical protein